MVRFIIRSEPRYKIFGRNLHSNMVRFIMETLVLIRELIEKFTFQYG